MAGSLSTLLQEGDERKLTKVHDVQIKILESEILQLLPTDRLNSFLLMEGIPELRDDEEILSFDQTIFDCSGNALACFDFVSVVLISVKERSFYRSGSVTYHMLNRRDDTQL